VRFSRGEGQLAVIEASDDLSEWIPICTNTIVAGNIMITDINGGQFAHRFYRAAIVFMTTPVSVSFQAIGNGQVTLQSSGGEGSLVVVEASDDLDAWTPISTNRISSGLITFSDFQNTYRPHRFYRATRRP
jgi:hypothetical protein